MKNIRPSTVNLMKSWSLLMMALTARTMLYRSYEDKRTDPTCQPLIDWIRTCQIARIPRLEGSRGKRIKTGITAQA